MYLTKVHAGPNAPNYIYMLNNKNPYLFGFSLSDATKFVFFMEGKVPVAMMMMITTV